MKFFETKLKGSYVIDVERNEDERGFFGRTWDKEIFQDMGLNSNLIQCNVSFNKKKGTIRGLHYQVSPYEEVRLVRCTKGEIFEVLVDLRENSETFMQWYGVKLDSVEHKMIYVPEKFALGVQILEDNTEIFYQMSQKYNQDSARGILWNDKKLNISWPLEHTIISKKDMQYKELK